MRTTSRSNREKYYMYAPSVDYKSAKAFDDILVELLSFSLQNSGTGILMSPNEKSIMSAPRVSHPIQVLSNHGVAMRIERISNF